jgi:argininosuccinate synthase
VIAPWREWSLKSREDCLDYAEQHGIPVAASREKIHSRDRNLWHLSHEGGELEDASNAPLASTWQLTLSPQEAPDSEEQVTIGFDAGIPASTWLRTGSSESNLAVATKRPVEVCWSRRIANSKHCASNAMWRISSNTSG